MSFTITSETRYQCPECEQILAEGERRCEDCRKFARKVDVVLCPKCDEYITEEDV